MSMINYLRIFYKSYCKDTKLEAEKITVRFKENIFDLVFARNSINHSYFPEISVLEMIKVIKKNCYVLLLHRTNEAEQEN